MFSSYFFMISAFLKIKLLTAFLIKVPASNGPPAGDNLFCRFGTCTA